MVYALFALQHKKKAKKRKRTPHKKKEKHKVNEVHEVYAKTRMLKHMVRAQRIILLDVLHPLCIVLVMVIVAKTKKSDKRRLGVRLRPKASQSRRPTERREDPRYMLVFTSSLCFSALRVACVRGL